MVSVRQIKIGARFLRYCTCRVRPYEVAAQLWNACDQKCIYCRCSEVATELLTTGEWRSIFGQLRQMGTLRVKFQGGEPTIRPDFPEICREVRRLGIITSVVTNGMAAAKNPDLLNDLQEVVISLDSLRPDINDFLRGEGAYEGATRTIGHSLERGLKTYINMALCQKNYGEVESMLAFAESRGMKINAQPIKFGVKYYDEKARTLALSANQIRDLHRRMIEWKKRGRAIMFSAASFRKALDWPDLTRNTVRSEGYSKCMAGNFYFHIDPNGDVVPCIPHGAEFSPKNILTDRLAEALTHARRHHCGDCWSPYLNERKDLFSLRPTALIEFFRRG